LSSWAGHRNSALVLPFHCPTLGSSRSSHAGSDVIAWESTPEGLPPRPTNCNRPTTSRTGVRYDQIMLVTLLPPPSVNECWRWFRGNMVRSKRYTDWLAHCTEVIEEQGHGPVATPCRVCVTVVPGVGITSRSDLDNLIKPIMDLLTPEKRADPKEEGEQGKLRKPGAGIIPDDNLTHVHEVVVRLATGTPKKRGKKVPPAVIVVRVQPIAEHYRDEEMRRIIWNHDAGRNDA